MPRCRRYSGAEHVSGSEINGSCFWESPYNLILSWRAWSLGNNDARCSRSRDSSRPVARKPAAGDLRKYPGLPHLTPISTHARTHAHRADRVKQSIVRRRAAYPRCARNDRDLIISEYPSVEELRAIGLATMTAILSRSAWFQPFWEFVTTTSFM